MPLNVLDAINKAKQATDTAQEIKQKGGVDLSQVATKGKEYLPGTAKEAVNIADKAKDLKRTATDNADKILPEATATKAPAKPDASTSQKTTGSTATTTNETKPDTSSAQSKTAYSKELSPESQQAINKSMIEKSIGEIMMNTEMSKADKMAELTRIKELHNIGDQEMRNIIGREATKGLESVNEMNLEQVRKLQEDIKALDRNFGNLGMLWEDNDLERALGRRESTLVNLEKQERLNAERLAQQEAARKAAEEAKRQAEEAKIKQQLVEQRIGQVMMDPEIPKDQKLAELKRIKEENKIGDQEMRNIIGREATKGLESVKEMNLEQVRKLKDDISAMDSKFGVAGMLWEDNDLERALGRRESTLVDLEKQERINAERQAREEAARKAAEEAKRQAQETAEKRQQIEQNIGQIMMDPNMSSADKMAELTRIKEANKIGDQEMRNIIGREATKGLESVNEMNLEQVRKLQEDIKALDRNFGVGGMLWEDNDLERALGRRESTLVNLEKQERLNAERLAQQEAARKAAEEAKRQAEEAKIKQQLVEQNIGQIMMDTEMPREEKLAELKRIKEENKIGDQEMRNIIGREATKGLESVKEMNLEQVRKLKDDISAMDSKFGNLGMLWEDNDLERALGKRESALVRQEAEQRANAERMQLQQDREYAKALLRGMNRDSYGGNKQGLDEVCKKHGFNEKELLKETLPELAQQIKTSINVGSPDYAEKQAYAIGQLAANTGLSQKQVIDALAKSGQFSKEEMKSIRSAVAAGYAFEQE